MDANEMVELERKTRVNAKVGDEYYSDRAPNYTIYKVVKVRNRTFELENGDEISKENGCVLRKKYSCRYFPVLPHTTEHVEREKRLHKLYDKQETIRNRLSVAFSNGTLDERERLTDAILELLNKHNNDKK